MRKKWLLFGLLFVCGGILLLTKPLFAEDKVQIKMSGVLGQSQPVGSEPLPFLGANGVLKDKKGMLWTIFGKEAFVFSKQNGSWICNKRLSLPAPMVHYLGLYSDGERFFFIGYDWKVYALNPETGALSVVCNDVKSASMIKFTVAPAGLTKGYAAQGKIFVLEGDAVRAYTANGEPVGTVLTLSRPADAKWHYCALGVEPNSGDLLIGSYHPDMKVYRFSPPGNEVTAEGWPRKAFSRYIINLDSLAWALTTGGGATSLPLTIKKEEDAKTLSPFWTEYLNGLVEDTEGYWLSTSQGIVRFDKSGAPLKKRIGGLPAVRKIAVNNEGIIIAAVEGGQLMVRFALDDEPDTIFTSNGNEPFRVGAGWTNKASSLAWDGKRFLVLDETAKQVWHFNPWHIGWQEKPWLPLSEKDLFQNPVSMAVAGNKVFVLDNGKILEAPLAAKLSFQETGISVEGAKAIAGCGKSLIIATSQKMVSYQETAPGIYQKEWEKESPAETTGLAASSDYIALISSKDNSLTIFSPDGETLARIRSEEVRGGFQPTAVAISSRWILVSDEKGKRVLRFEVVEKGEPE